VQGVTAVYLSIVTAIYLSRVRSWQLFIYLVSAVYLSIVTAVYLSFIPITAKSLYSCNIQIKSNYLFHIYYCLQSLFFCHRNNSFLLKYQTKTETRAASHYKQNHLHFSGEIIKEYIKLSKRLLSLSLRQEPFTDSSSTNR